MTTAYLIRLLLITIIFFHLSIPSLQAEEHTADQGCLTEHELDIFCKDFPDVINSLTRSERDQYFRQVLENCYATVFQLDPNRSFPSSLSSTRFNYILNHILLAGVVEELGGFGEDKLKFLEKQKNKVLKHRSLSESERKAALQNLEMAIDQVKRLQKQTEELPNTELVLLWSRKDVLHDLLDNVIPMEKQKLAAH